MSREGVTVDEFLGHQEYFGVMARRRNVKIQAPRLGAA
jgi:hypothetical protein